MNTRQAEDEMPELLSMFNGTAPEMILIGEAKKRLRDKRLRRLRFLAQVDKGELIKKAKRMAKDYMEHQGFGLKGRNVRRNMEQWGDIWIRLVHDYAEEIFFSEYEFETD